MVALVGVVLIQVAQVTLLCEDEREEHRVILYVVGRAQVIPLMELLLNLWEGASPEI